MGNKKLNIEFKDGNLAFGADFDQDGSNSIEGTLYLNEALQEVINRGEKIEGAKVVDFKFELTTLVLVLDTDKDGEKLFELRINLGEGFDEATSLFKKDETTEAEA